MKKIIKDILESLLVMFLVIFLTVTNLFSSLDYMLKDALYQIPRGVDNDIKIIAIDEMSHSMQNPSGNLKRSSHPSCLTSSVPDLRWSLRTQLHLHRR